MRHFSFEVSGIRFHSPIIIRQDFVPEIAEELRVLESHEYTAYRTFDSRMDEWV
jgi:hypothetical protein